MALQNLLTFLIVGWKSKINQLTTAQSIGDLVKIFAVTNPNKIAMVQQVILPLGINDLNVKALPKGPWTWEHSYSRWAVIFQVFFTAH